jgi:hypothetical protein
MRYVESIDFNPAGSTDFVAQANDVLAKLVTQTRFEDAVTARKSNDWGGLTYHIARALGLDFHAPVKLGLIWAVADAIDALQTD